MRYAAGGAGTIIRRWGCWACGFWWWNNAAWGEKGGITMTVPDVRRLLQVVLAVAAPRNLVAHAIALSQWRQERNRVARECHTKTRRRRWRQWLRNTG